MLTFYQDANNKVKILIMVLVSFFLILSIYLFILMPMKNENNIKEKNVLGTDLQSCSCDPKTGFFRDGFCSTSKKDSGLHTVCAIMTDEFLNFSKKQGNDLSTPNLAHQFPGLKANDKWCLCAGRWIEAVRAQKAPPIILESSHESLLELISSEELNKYTFL